MRIVSLSAGATEIVHALGLGEYLVGRSHQCDYPSQVESLAICTDPRDITGVARTDIDEWVRDVVRETGSLHALRGDLIGSLHPTHVITQAQPGEEAIARDSIEQAVSDTIDSHPKVVVIEPRSLGGIETAIRRVAAACGLERQGRELVESLRVRLGEIAPAAWASGIKPTVACIEWQQPLVAAGYWIPELVEMAGATNLFSKAGEPSVLVTLDELAEADPEVILMMTHEGDMCQVRSQMRLVEEDPRWTSLRAVQTDRVVLVYGNQHFSRPSPRIVDTLWILCEILHPEVFQPTLAGIAWERYSPDTQAC